MIDIFMVTASIATTHQRTSSAQMRNYLTYWVFNLAYQTV